MELLGALLDAVAQRTDGVASHLLELRATKVLVKWRRPTQQELPGLAESGKSLQAHVEGGHEALCFGQYGRREVDHVVFLRLCRVLRAMHAHVEGHRLAVVKNERAEGEVVGDARVLLAQAPLSISRTPRSPS